MLALMAALSSYVTAGAKTLVAPEGIICEENQELENSREEMLLSLQHHNCGLLFVVFFVQTNLWKRNRTYV